MSERKRVLRPRRGHAASSSVCRFNSVAPAPHSRGVVWISQGVRIATIALLLANISCTKPDFIREVCPPDNRPVFVPTDCAQGYEIFATPYQSSLTASLNTLKGNASLSGTLGESVVQLAEALDQRTSRFRTTFVGLCQSQVADPCNAEVQKRVTDARTSLALQFEQSDQEVQRIIKTAEALASTSSAEEGPLKEKLRKDIQAATAKAQSEDL